MAPATRARPRSGVGGRRSPITLAGITVAREHIAWLAENLDDPIADRLRRALTNGVRILGLDVDERESLLRAMTDPTDGLLELRATLLREHVGRKRDELA